MAYRVAFRDNRGFNLGPIGFLIIINIILFITTSIKYELLFQLGLVPAFFLQRPWTIITSMFVHAGFGHIFANMLTLYFFGSYLIQLIGERYFWIVYFFGGILGSILYILLAPPLSVAVGASGAVFALGGALTVLRPRLRVFIFPIPIPIPLWVSVIGGFFIMSFLPFVAWQAHLGGLVFGLAAAYFFKHRRRYFF
ncbi:rhomboid family intramembrane serine protease [Chloroflexota bacterium]